MTTTGALIYCPFPNTVHDNIPVQRLDDVQYQKLNGEIPPYNYTWVVNFCKREPEESLLQLSNETCGRKGKAGSGMVFGMVANMDNGKCDSAFELQKNATCGNNMCNLQYQQVIQGQSSALFYFNIRCNPNRAFLQNLGNVIDNVSALDGRVLSRTMTAEWIAACDNFTGFGSVPTPQPQPQAAAGDDPKGYFGTALIIILIVGVVLYLIGGIAYNKIKGGTGTHIHGEFWSSVPDHFINGHKFVRSKFTGGSSDYHGVAAAEGGSSTV